VFILSVINGLLPNIALRASISSVSLINAASNKPIEEKVNGLLPPGVKTVIFPLESRKRILSPREDTE
jgi:hypothetical protein